MCFYFLDSFYVKIYLFKDGHSEIKGYQKCTEVFM